jgi:hypothetical protein
VSSPFDRLDLIDVNDEPLSIAANAKLESFTRREMAFQTGSGAAPAQMIGLLPRPQQVVRHWPAILPPLIVLSRLSLARSAENASARFILQLRPSESMSHAHGRPTTQWRGMETLEEFKQLVAHERGLAVRLSVASEWLEETRRERVWVMAKSMRRGGPSFRSRPPRVPARVGSTSSSD